MLFALDGGGHADEALVVNEAVNPVAGSKSGKHTGLVLEHTLAQIAGYSGVERSRPIGHDVNVVITVGMHRSFPLRSAQGQDDIRQGFASVMGERRRLSESHV